ncbi:MAG: hypothetical protein GC137_07620 [Alphaproteobacteria bacterium]|nr:hypothetical protein [Alphaproteobacteria bacterium]
MRLKNLYVDSSFVPEFNSSVWERYLELYKAHIKGYDSLQIHLFEDIYGFYCDPLDEKTCLSWALAGPIPHFKVPFKALQIIENANKVCASLQDRLGEDAKIVTDTFEFLDDAGIVENAFESHFLWVNSPVASIEHGFDTYTQSLNSKRRNKFKTAWQAHDNESFTCKIDSNLTIEDLDFVLENCAAKWKEDQEYALVQFLWAKAVSDILPQRIHVLRIYERDRLEILKAYITKGSVGHVQATIRRHDSQSAGLSSYADYQFMKRAFDIGLRAIDPNCRSSTDDPEAIVISKRSIVNKNAVRPIFLAGKMDSNQKNYPFAHREKWINSNNLTIIGDLL